ncbi:MAG: hypothetical protein GTO22_00150 [Gemmatimonadales bacterium]|nr:hypothetical protein [Gemmatimonadales bacterium]
MPSVAIPQAKKKPALKEVQRVLPGMRVGLATVAPDGRDHRRSRNLPAAGRRCLSGVSK